MEHKGRFELTPLNRSIKKIAILALIAVSISACGQAKSEPARINIPFCQAPLGIYREPDQINLTFENFGTPPNETIFIEPQNIVGELVDSSFEVKLENNMDGSLAVTVPSNHYHVTYNDNVTRIHYAEPLMRTRDYTFTLTSNISGTSNLHIEALCK